MTKFLWLFICLTCVTPQFSAQKKIGEYRKDLKEVHDRVKNLTNVKFYKVQFKHKTTGEIKELYEIPALDKNVFFLMMAEKLSDDLEDLDIAWQKDIKKFQGTKTDDQVEDRKDDEDAKKEDVEKFAAKLLSLRKQHAKQWEDLTEFVFKTFPSAFTEDEMNLYRKSMRDYHDKHKLVERK